MTQLQCVHPGKVVQHKSLDRYLVTLHKNKLLCHLVTVCQIISKENYCFWPKTATHCCTIEFCTRPGNEPRQPMPLILKNRMLNNLNMGCVRKASKF